MEWGEREMIYLSLHSHHHNDILMFHIVRDKIKRQCPQTTTVDESGEPKRNRTEVPLLTSLTPYRWAKPAHERSISSGGLFNLRPSVFVYF